MLDNLQKYGPEVAATAEGLQQELFKLLEIVGHHPESRKAITKDKFGHYRVYGVAAASCGGFRTLLPGHVVDEPAKGYPIMYYFINGTDDKASGFTVMQKPDTGIIDASRYAADKSRLWDFAHTSDHELKAHPLQGSQFLDDRQDELTRLHDQLPQLWTDMQAMSDKLCTEKPTNPYEWRKTWQQVAELESQCYDDATKAGQHSTDAECHWMLGVLENDAIKKTIDFQCPEGLWQKFPLVVHLHLSTAPCDQCCSMILSQHQALEDRFKCKVHVVISAVLGYSDTKCLGLAALSQSVDWLDFLPRWQSVDQALLG